MRKYSKHCYNLMNKLYISLSLAESQQRFQRSTPKEKKKKNIPNARQ